MLNHIYRTAKPKKSHLSRNPRSAVVSPPRTRLMIKLKKLPKQRRPKGQLAAREYRTPTKRQRRSPTMTRHLSPIQSPRPLEKAVPLRKRLRRRNLRKLLLKLLQSRLRNASGRLLLKMMKRSLWKRSRREVGRRRLLLNVCLFAKGSSNIIRAHACLDLLLLCGVPMLSRFPFKVCSIPVLTVCGLGVCLVSYVSKRASVYVVCLETSFCSRKSYGQFYYVSIQSLN
jgi:hypothetical protein